MLRLYIKEFILKNFNKKFSFYESKNDQYLGVEIDDLYAGYVRYCITNNLKINNSINYYEFE